MLRKVSGRLEQTHLKLAQLALTDVRKRLANLLLEATSENGGAVPFGSEQIAALLGCSREMVSRVVRSMAQRGAVHRNGRKLRVVQRDVLREIAALP
jgi:CRP/FNR family cyclic AMP-dependent transcriptional regulator